MTVGERFREVGSHCFVHDAAGDHVWNGEAIVPMQKGEGDANEQTTEKAE